jgi:hypothetical protein
MSIRTIEVEAMTVLDARAQAMEIAGRDMFDPIRVVDSKVAGFLRFGPQGALFCYRVHIEGQALTEGEARELWGK